MFQEQFLMILAPCLLDYESHRTTTTEKEHHEPDLGDATCSGTRNARTPKTNRHKCRGDSTSSNGSTIGVEIAPSLCPMGGDTSPEQQYSLRWNDFHSSILSSFRHLRDEEDFVDVTLACDGCSFKAHKVVLSACSPYFRRLLKANPASTPSSYSGTCDRRTWRAC
ncbi:hypothetical protein NQ318_007404 [Aromia moschata]|uniref:BTB domain-containing protein n=1 Tax=Aromia moschata TaxID=1265417 RepID=A0AAV8YKU0_9CUCU|nr:hypothetical protein NQ318_007404 [Aromia moschata]